MTTRIGMVNYINTAPIYEVWKEQVRDPAYTVVEAPPTTLNRMLAEAALDLGFVSSYTYAQYPDQYLILADLSIAATGPVGSVFLFSKLEIDDLDGQQVLLTKQSDTSVALVRIILEEYVGVRPVYTSGNVLEASVRDDGPAALLAIGDDALRLAQEKRYPVQLDLSAAWFAQTKLPFVFALCCVRRAYAQARPQSLDRLHRLLLGCRNQGLARLDEICARVARRIPMDCTACSRYLHAMEYDLGPAKLEGLERFFSILIRRGEAATAALPLQLYPENHQAEAGT